MDGWILMVRPCRLSTLSKETTTVYDKTTSSKFDTLQAPSSDIYSLAAYLPTCRKALWFSAVEAQFWSRSETSQEIDQARNEYLGLDPD